VTRKRKPKEEVSAGGIVFRREGDRTLFLIIRDPYRHWGFPKGHLEPGEEPAQAALREVAEEAGIGGLELRAPIETIEWTFRFRGRAIHKTCHFFLIETAERRTAPQRAEGISACRWASYDQARKLITYANARAVLDRAQTLLGGSSAPVVDAPPALEVVADDATPVVPILRVAN
jgi:8-oxo-dGTP pyrophosphatase MutT (NUDIX family)